MSGLAPHTATAGNNLARDVAAEPTGQEQGHARNILGSARPTQRNALYEARLNLITPLAPSSLAMLLASAMRPALEAA